MPLSHDEWVRQHGNGATAPCGKRKYSSQTGAREAHRRMGARLRVYWCAPCRAYHVTNAEKRD